LNEVRWIRFLELPKQVLVAIELTSFTFRKNNRLNDIHNLLLSQVGNQEELYYYEEHDNKAEYSDEMSEFDLLKVYFNQR